MGVRALNNIKIVKSSPIGTFNNLSGVVVPPTLFINPNKIKSAKLTSLDQEMVKEKSVLTADEARIFDKVWKEIKYRFNKKNKFDNFSTILDVVESLSIIASFALKKISKSGLIVGEWPINQKTDLVELMTDLNLLNNSDNAYYCTLDTKVFRSALSKLDYAVPFDWDNFSDHDSDPNDYPPFGDDNVLNAVTINDQEYTFETNPYDTDISTQAISTIFYKDPVFYDEIQLPAKKLPAYREPITSSPYKQETLNYMLDNIKNADVEMIPISSSCYFSTLQGTIDGKPVFTQLRNDVFKYCRNVYGNNLRIVLDLYGILNGKEKNINIGRYFIIDGNNEVVFSCAEDQELYFAPGSQYQGRKMSFNTTSFNLNLLKRL